MTTTDKQMMTYTFGVIVEPDGDRWHVRCPMLERQGGATWGYSREEALSNIREVVEMVVESMRDHGEPIPTERTSQELAVTVTV